MRYSEKSKDLEAILPKLLGEAMFLISKDTRAITLFTDSSKKQGYLLFPEGIQKHWADEYPDGSPVTKWADINDTDFLNVLHNKPYTVKQQVYTNLRNYVQSTQVADKKQSGFVSPHLLGY